MKLCTVHDSTLPLLGVFRQNKHTGICSPRNVTKKVDGHAAPSAPSWKQPQGPWTAGWECQQWHPCRWTSTQHDISYNTGKSPHASIPRRGRRTSVFPLTGRFFFNINLSIYLFIYWLHWFFVAACGLSLVAVSGGYSSLLCAGFSSRWLLLLRSTGSKRAGFRSCGTWAQ